MARAPISHHGTRQGVHGGSSLDRSRATRKKKPYKVVMEVITQEKKKLRSVMTYSAESPIGYTFVPLGHPDLTEYCKERCRRRNLEAHIVTAQPKGKKQTDPRRTSIQAPRIDTQRIGHHFPNQVIDEACDVLRYVWRNGTFHKSSLDPEETRLARSLHDYGQRMRLHGRPMTEKETEDQIRNAILEVFPKIPPADLNGVVNHAFEEGTNRVGNAKDLTLARRVQLAVGAFIRHQYTSYDTILKTGGTWPEARSQVQSITYGKLKEWRDESDDSNELEETFREIIVLDDEDDDETDTTGDNSYSEREESLEIISSQATARELQPDNPADFVSANGQSVGRRSRRMIYLEPMRRPTFAGATEAYQPRQVVTVPVSSQLAAQSTRYQDPDLRFQHVRQQADPPRDLAASNTGPVRASDGKWYNLEPIGESRVNLGTSDAGGLHLHEYTPSPISAPYNPRDPYVHVPKRVSLLENANFNRPTRPNRDAIEDTVLPSVEAETETIASPKRVTDPSHLRYQDHTSIPVSRNQMVQSSVGKAFGPSLFEEGDRHYERAPKRLKPLDHGSLPLPQPPASMYNRFHNRPLPETYTRPRASQTYEPAQQHYEVIDLTSSPRHRANVGGEVDVFPVSAYAASDPASHSYVPAAPRTYPARSAVNEGRYDSRYGRVRTEYY